MQGPLGSESRLLRFYTKDLYNAKTAVSYHFSYLAPQMIVINWWKSFTCFDSGGTIHQYGPTPPTASIHGSTKFLWHFLSRGRRILLSKPFRRHLPILKLSRCTDSTTWSIKNKTVEQREIQKGFWFITLLRLISSSVGSKFRAVKASTDDLALYSLQTVNKWQLDRSPSQR